MTNTDILKYSVDFYPESMEKNAFGSLLAGLGKQVTKGIGGALGGFAKGIAGGTGYGKQILNYKPIAAMSKGWDDLLGSSTTAAMGSGLGRAVGAPLGMAGRVIGEGSFALPALRGLRSVLRGDPVSWGAVGKNLGYGAAGLGTLGLGANYMPSLTDENGFLTPSEMAKSVWDRGLGGRLGKAYEQSGSLGGTPGQFMENTAGGLGNLYDSTIGAGLDWGENALHRVFNPDAYLGGMAADVKFKDIQNMSANKRMDFLNTYYDTNKELVELKNQLAGNLTPEARAKYQKDFDKLKAQMDRFLPLRDRIIDSFPTSVTKGFENAANQSSSFDLASILSNPLVTGLIGSGLGYAGGGLMGSENGLRNALLGGGLGAILPLILPMLLGNNRPQQMYA